MATLEQIDTKTGEYGDYYRMKIDGQWYSAFLKSEPEVAVGDQVAFTTKRKGKYENIDSISRVGDSGRPNAGAVAASSLLPDPIKLDSNLMMMAKYAIDLQVAGRDLPTSVKLVYETTELMRKYLTGKVEPPAGAKPDYTTAAEVLASALGLDPKATYWAEFVKSYKKDWALVLKALQEVQSGAKVIEFTPDNKLILSKKG